MNLEVGDLFWWSFLWIICFRISFYRPVKQVDFSGMSEFEKFVYVLLTVGTAMASLYGLIWSTLGIVSVCMGANQ